MAITPLTDITNGTAIDATPVQANFTSLEAYVDGLSDGTNIDSLAITTAKLAADAVTGAKIADDSIDSEHYVDGSIDTAHIGDLQVTTAKLAADAVTGAKIADNAIDSEHYVDGSIDGVHLASSVGGTLNSGNLFYRKLGDIVYFWGETAGNPTFPSGYRPAATAKFPASDSISVGNVGLFQIATNGVTSTSGLTSNDAWVTGAFEAA